MQKRLTIKERRDLPHTLEGVRLTVVTAIPVGDGLDIPPGADVTDVGRGWAMLPTLLKRGTVRAEPPVDWGRLDMKAEAARPQPGREVSHAGTRKSRNAR